MLDRKKIETQILYNGEKINNIWNLQSTKGKTIRYNMTAHGELGRFSV